MQEQRHAFQTLLARRRKGIKIHSKNNPLFDAEKKYPPCPLIVGNLDPYDS
jgi:hypothetical protein